MPIVPLTDSIFDDIVDEAKAIARGDPPRGRVHHVAVPAPVDVRAIRAKLGLTQLEFASRFGFTVRAVQHWEQGTRQPEGPARVLIALIEVDHKTISRLLKRAGLAA